MSSEETKVAVMQKQVEYITKQVDAIVSKLDDVVKNSESRMDRFQLEVDKRFEGVHARIENKADKGEVEKINKVLGGINWIIIVAIIGAGLTLILK